MNEKPDPTQQPLPHWVQKLSVLGPWIGLGVSCAVVFSWTMAGLWMSLPSLLAPRAEVAPTATNSQRVQAKAGVGAKGRYQQSGLVFTPIKAYFRTQQRTELEIKIPHALNLYRAEHGHFPKTHEEFIREIVEFNQIKLPQLPPGHRYIYDPKSGQLQVEQPQE